MTMHNHKFNLKEASEAEINSIISIIYGFANFQSFIEFFYMTEENRSLYLAISQLDPAQQKILEQIVRAFLQENQFKIGMFPAQRQPITSALQHWLHPMKKISFSLKKGLFKGESDHSFTLKQKPHRGLAGALKTISNAAFSDTSASAIPTGKPRSTRLVTPKC